MKRTFIWMMLGLVFIAFQAQALPFFPIQVPKGANLRQDVVFRGTPVSPGGESWKFTVQIWSNNSLCTGVVIDTNMILTAAHCKDEKSDVLMVTFFKGSDPAYQKMYKSTDFTFTQNPSYVEGLAHDHGVLVFNQSILPDKAYHIARFLTSADVSSINIGSKAYLIGAGRIGTQKDKETYRKLNFITGVISDYTDGGYGIALFGAETTGICHGDSGGPMFVKVRDEFLLVGLNSQIAVDFEDQACNNRFYISMISAEDFNWIFSVTGPRISPPSVQAQ